MQLIEKSPATAELPQVGNGITGLSDAVREETLKVLLKAGIIRDVEAEGFRNYLVGNSISSGDILPVMATLRGIDELEQSPTVTNWARAIAPVIKRRYSLVPFAGRLLGNASLFDSYEVLHQAAAAVKCPLIFSEDADVIGFGTLNPVAGVLLGDFAAKYLSKEVGVTPYISMFLLDIPTWETSCRRQFEQ